MIAFPPDHEPIPINGRKLRGIVAHISESEYGPGEMLSEKAAERVEMELAGEAAKAESPVIPGPLSPLHDHDPLLLALYHHMVKQHEENLGTYKDHTSEIMHEIIKSATAFGIPAGLIPNYAPIFGKRLIALIPQFLAVGLKVTYKHRKKGTQFEIAWEVGYPKDDPGDGSSSSSPPQSPGKAMEPKPLRRSDGRDVDELFSRLATLPHKTKDPQP